MPQIWGMENADPRARARISTSSQRSLPSRRAPFWWFCLACSLALAIFIARNPAQEMDAVMQLQSQTPDPVPPSLPELPPILPETPEPKPKPKPEPETEKPPILN